MAAARYRKLPVTVTGIYRNDAKGQLEYWFAVGDQRALIGACKQAMPPSVRESWERETTRALRNLISRKVKDGTLRVATQPVAGSTNTAG